MEYYIVEENQKVKKYKRKYNELVLLDITYDDDLEVCSLLDENKPFHNLIQRNEYLDLYHDKPLIEDESPPDNLYSVKISEPAINADQSPSKEEMNWSDYHNLEVIENWLDSLENTYPSLCTVVPIGTTLEGRLINVLRVSNSEVGNAPVWVDAGIHAREWIAPAVNTFIADYVVRNFDSLPESFTNKDWYFLPVANPDGYDYSHKVERLWRKNRAWYGGECIGVDLNRNFSFAWGGRNSSTDPSSPFFRGRQPFSEPESSAMRVKYQPLVLFNNVQIDWLQLKSFKKDILVNSGIKFKVYITLHSYGQVIVFPYGYRDELCPDYVRLLEGATAMSKAIFASTGNIYKVGISKDVMYGASGTSTDWSYGSAHIPFCYLIELRSKQYKFNLPKEEIQETCNEILNCVKALMKFVDNHPSRSVTSL